MGVYAECQVFIDWEEDVKEETLLKFIEEVNKSEEISLDLQGIENLDCLNMASGRVQNLEYQLEKLLEIIKKYPIAEANGNIMVEGDGGINYVKDEE